ncbi:MAG: metallophosphoesterase [Candidatus Brocadiia bacterium]|nr:metallophosphoesterase [Candidatus Brocadiia bacterium]
MKRSDGFPQIVRFLRNIPVLLFVCAILAVYALDVCQLVRFAVGVLGDGPAAHHLTSMPVLALHAVALIGLLCVGYGYFIEPYRIAVTRIRLRTPKLSRTRLRIAQITDLHCERKQRNERKLADLINPLEPDLIVFTGDSLNSIAGLERFREALATLDARIGKFAVRGNVDDRRYPDVDLFESTGFRCLSAEAVALEKDNETFWLSGVDFRHEDRYREVLERVPKGCYSAFLCHYPDLIEGLCGINADVYLAGHTHGGQVRLPLYGALVTFSRYGKRYEAGRYTVGETTLYVNRGVGLEGSIAPRVRFLCRPEIAVFDIEPA